MIDELSWQIRCLFEQKSRGKSLKSVLKNSVTRTHIATYNQNYSSLYSIDRRSLRDTIMVMYLIYFAKWMKSTSTQSIIRFHIITLLECFSTVLRLFPAENNNVHFSGYWLSYVWQVVEGSFFQLFLEVLCLAVVLNWIDFGFSSAVFVLVLWHQSFKPLVPQRANIRET